MRVCLVCRGGYQVLSLGRGGGIRGITGDPEGKEEGRV